VGRTEYPEQWLAVRDWLASFRRYLIDSSDVSLRGHGLVLVGEPGVGKTMLASAALNYLHAKGFTTAFVRDGDLMKLLSLRYPTEEDTDLLGYLQRAACLVVDDLGRTSGSIEGVEPFLRYRMDEAKPTVVTINNAVPLTATLESFLHEYTFVSLAGLDRRVSPLEPHNGRW
jgi:DNA replication protein DnaC